MHVGILTSRSLRTELLISVSDKYLSKLNDPIHELTGRSGVRATPGSSSKYTPEV